MLKCDINVILNAFRTGLHRLVDSYVPTKHRKSRNLHEPLWFNSGSSTTTFKSLVILITWLNINNYVVVIKKIFRKLKASFLVNRLYQPLSSGYTKPFYKYVTDLKGNEKEIISIENTDGILTA